MAFDPRAPLAPRLQILENATIVPYGAGKWRGVRRPGGVFTADGDFVQDSTCYRYSDLVTIGQPDGAAPQPVEHLKGTYLYGGLLYKHFGHFLAESTGRFWALDHVDMPVDGVVFLPKKKLTWPKRFARPMRGWLSKFDPVLANVHAPVDPVSVERLIIAPQGFGTNDMMWACPEYRDYVHSHFGANIPAAGADKVYISRSRLFSKRGRYLAEDRIEQLLIDEGYTIFHPQDEPLDVQIAQYKAATHIISSDSSALHLAAFFMGAEDQVAIVKRRPGRIVEDFLWQFESFAGKRPAVIDALNGAAYRFAGADEGQTSELFTELDLKALGAELGALGFVRAPSKWRNPTAKALAEERAAWAAKAERDLEPCSEAAA
jgi:capsular polysaccharide biosynthesis protein